MLLSACIKLDMNLEIHTDDTVSGSMIMGASRDILPMLGGEESVRQQIKDSFQQDAPEGVEVTDYSDDRFVGVEATFANVSIEEFNGEADATGADALVRHEGTKFIVDTTLPLSGEEFGAGELGSVAGSGEIRVAVTFPGQVLSHNGALNGTTVTWTGTLGEDLVMQAEANDSGANPSGGLLGGSGDGGGGNMALWIGLGVVVAAGLVGLFLYLRKQSAAPAVATVGATDTAGTIADYDTPAAPEAQAAPVWAPADEPPTRVDLTPPAEPYGYTPPSGGEAPGAGDAGSSSNDQTSVLSDIGETDTPPAGQPPVQPPAQPTQDPNYRPPDNT